MKRIILLFLVIIICITASGCGKNGDTVYISVSGENFKTFTEFAGDYNKNAGEKIKIITDEKHPDIFSFNDIKEISSAKDKCLNLSSFVDEKNLLLSDGGTAYAIGGDIILYYLICNKKYFDNPDNITAPRDLLAYAENENFFTPLSDNKNYINALLSLPIFAELSLNEDYDNPLFATFNAKQIVFFNEDKMKNFYSFYQKYSLPPTSIQNAIELFKSGKTAVMFVSSKDINALDSEKIAALPISFTGNDKPSILVEPQKYYAINKNSKNIKEAKQFFKAFADKNAVLDNKNGNIEIIPVLSSAFPETFRENAPENVTELLSGKSDFDSTVKALKTLWKNGRETNQAQ